jgi:hypothetical protein
MSSSRSKNAESKSLIQNRVNIAVCLQLPSPWPSEVLQEVCTDAASIYHMPSMCWTLPQFTPPQPSTISSIVPI